MARAAFIGGMVGMQLQFFSLFAKLSIPWPNDFKTILYILELFNLDPRDLFGEFDWPVIDFRVLFILVANLLPLFITVLMLVLFQPLYVVAWYILTMGSSIMMVAGLVMHFLEGMDVGVWYAAGGGFLFAICVVIGGTAYGMGRMDKKDEDDVEQAQRQRRAASLAFSKRRVLYAFLTTLALFFAGAVLTGLFFTLSFSNRENNSLRVLGYICFGLCLFALIYFFAVLTAPGRAKLLKIGEFMNANFLMVMMLILSITYVPCITYCVNNFMCANYYCPAGTVFNPMANRTSGSYDRSIALYCDPCDFLDKRCVAGTNASINPFQACPEWTGSRLWTSPDVPCGDPASIFFTISACLVLPVYLFAIPLLYIRMIGKITAIITKEAHLIPHNDKENVEFLPPTTQYERKVYAVEPAAASLYQPFKLQHKFAMIILLILRLLMVVVTAMIAPYLPQNVIWVLLGIHFAVTAIILAVNPFIQRMEYFLTVGCSGCNVLNCVYAILVLYEVGLPGWVAWILLGLNIIIPVALMIYTTKFINDANSKAEKDLKAHKKSMRKLQKKGQSGGNTAGAAPVAVAATAGAARGGRGAQYQVQEKRPMKQQQGRGRGGKHYDIDDEMGVPLMDVNSDLDEDVLDPFASSDSFDDALGPPVVAAAAPQQRSKAAAIEVPVQAKLSDKEKKAILDKNSALATSLNYRTSAMITRYFMVIGFVLLLALGAAGLGYIRHETSEFVDGTSNLQRSYKIVLGGYTDWQSFTDSCCCIMSDHPPVDYKLEERWVCDNGMVVARGRIDISDHSGLAIRDFCAVDFTVNASVWVNNTFVSIQYWDPTELKDVSTKAQALYW